MTGGDVILRAVAIIEDSQKETDMLNGYFAQYSAEKGVEFKVTAFNSGEQFLDKYRPIYDIVIIDIGLPKMNGMEVAAKLRRTDDGVIIIFVTNMAQYAIHGYEVDAFDFIVKPISYANFAFKLHRVLNKICARVDAEILVTTSNEVIRIASSKIKFIEITGHTIIYHTLLCDIKTYGSLKGVESKLNSKTFVRCNNCYLVNLNYVYALKGNIVVVDDAELQISRNRKKDFLNAVNDFFGGGI